MRSDRKHITAVLDNDTEARDFIHSGKKTDGQPPSPLAVQMARGLATQPPAKRRKLSIRLPQEIDDLLSQVWHERGLARSQGKLPIEHVHEKQDIIAEALREWFEKRGYLTQKIS